MNVEKDQTYTVHIKSIPDYKNNRKQHICMSCGIVLDDKKPKSIIMIELIKTDDPLDYTRYICCTECLNMLSYVCAGGRVVKIPLPFYAENMTKFPKYTFKFFGTKD